MTEPQMALTTVAQRVSMKVLGTVSRMDRLMDFPMVRQMVVKKGLTTAPGMAMPMVQQMVW
jgi:hypothetical protein